MLNGWTSYHIQPGYKFTTLRTDVMVLKKYLEETSVEESCEQSRQILNININRIDVRKKREILFLNQLIFSM
jgi:hypothetical protein